MLLALLALLHATPIDSTAVYDGRKQALSVALPRLDAAVVVDGVLDEATWQSAAILTGFSHFQPIDGVPAADSTEVRIWYSATAIHFGVSAREPHGEVHATLADRDRIFADDYMQILIGTFDDGRQAFMFAVNPLGVQADGAMVERGVTAGGGFGGGAAAAREGSDLSPDYVFELQGSADRRRLSDRSADPVQEPPLPGQHYADLAAPRSAHHPALRIRGLLGAGAARQRIVPGPVRAADGSERA